MGKEEQFMVDPITFNVNDLIYDINRCDNKGKSRESPPCNRRENARFSEKTSNSCIAVAGDESEEKYGPYRYEERNAKKKKTVQYFL